MSILKAIEAIQKNKKEIMSKLLQNIDSSTGLGYKITFSCEMGGFFVCETSRTDFNDVTFSMKQTLGKDGFSDEKLIELINWQESQIEEKFNNHNKENEK